MVSPVRFFVQFFVHKPRILAAETERNSNLCESCFCLHHEAEMLQRIRTIYFDEMLAKLVGGWNPKVVPPMRDSGCPDPKLGGYFPIRQPHVSPGTNKRFDHTFINFHHPSSKHTLTLS